MKHFIKLVQNGIKEQQTSDMEINMILLQSNFFILLRAPVSPPHNRYDIYSEFAHCKKTGFGFGCGRD